MTFQDVYACVVCGYGVSGIEIHSNWQRNLQAMINDRAVGRPGMVSDGATVAS